MTTKRIAIAVGHHPASPGVTVRDDAGAVLYNEYNFNADLADKLWPELHALGIGSQVFLRPERGYTRGMRRLMTTINAWQPDLVFSLHSNGSTAAKASGAEALHWPVDDSQRDRETVIPKGDRFLEDCARRIAEAYAACIGIRNRGTIAQSNSWNETEPAWGQIGESKGKRIPNGPPLHILRDCKCVIGESHFMSNPADHKKAAAALADGSLPKALALALAACVAG